MSHELNNETPAGQGEGSSTYKEAGKYIMSNTIEPYAVWQHVDEETPFDWGQFTSGEKTYCGTVRVDHGARRVRLAMPTGTPQVALRGMLESLSDIALTPTEPATTRDYGVTLNEADRPYLATMERARACGDALCRATVHWNPDPTHVHSTYGTTNVTVEVCRSGRGKWRVWVDVQEEITPREASTLGRRLEAASAAAARLNRGTEAIEVMAS